MQKEERSRIEGNTTSGNVVARVEMEVESLIKRIIGTVQVST